MSEWSVLVNERETLSVCVCMRDCINVRFFCACIFYHSLGLITQLLCMSA